MTEHLITFETAELANEKGFDWYTSTYIDDEGDIIEDDTASLIGAIPAPTQSLLQKWLRDVHKVDVCVTANRFTGWEEIGYWTYAIKGITPTKNYRFNSYEEALEAALIHALNLIS